MLRRLLNCICRSISYGNEVPENRRLHIATEVLNHPFCEHLHVVIPRKSGKCRVGRWRFLIISFSIPRNTVLLPCLFFYRLEQLLIQKCCSRESWRRHIYLKRAFVEGNMREHESTCKCCWLSSKVTAARTQIWLRWFLTQLKNNNKNRTILCQFVS
jgi:hypothetical protein